MDILLILKIYRNLLIKLTHNLIKKIMEKNNLTRMIIEYLNTNNFKETSVALEKESLISSESKKFKKIKEMIILKKFDEAVDLIESNYSTLEMKLSVPFVRINQIFSSISDVFSEEKSKNFENKQKTLDLIRKIIYESPKIYQLNSILSNMSHLLFIDKEINLLEKMEKYCPISFSKESLIEYLSNILCNFNKNLFRKFQSKNLMSIIKKVYARQIQECIYHNIPENTVKYSFFKDHLCSENNLPHRNMLSIDDHNDEICNIILSHNNEHIAIVLKTNVVLIYKLVYELDKRKSGKHKKCISEKIDLNNEECLHRNNTESFNGKLNLGKNK